MTALVCLPPKPGVAAESDQQLLRALQSADDACEHVAGRVRGLETEIRNLRMRHTERIVQLQDQQGRYSSCLKLYLHLRAEELQLGQAAVVPCGF